MTDLDFCKATYEQLNEPRPTLASYYLAWQLHCDPSGKYGRIGDSAKELAFKLDAWAAAVKR